MNERRDRHHRRQRPVRHGRADRSTRKSALTTPFGDPSGPYVLGTLRGRRVAFLARHGAGHRHQPVGAELPRQHLRHEDAGRRGDPLGQRRRQPEGGATSRSTSSCPISSSTARAGRISTFFGDGIVAHVGFAHPICGDARRRSPATRGETVGATRAPRRHLRLHGGAAVLDAGRVAALSLVGRGHHRHDQPAGGQARARGRDLLHDHRAGHRLRLLAPRPRRGDRGHGHRDAAPEREDRAAAHRRSRGAAAGRRARARARRALQVRDHHAARGHSGGGEAGTRADHRQIHAKCECEVAECECSAEAATALANSTSYTRLQLALQDP